MRRLQILVASLLVSGAGWFQCSLGAPTAKPKRPPSDLTPRIVYLDGHATPDLPAPLSTLLRSKFAAYRVPSPSDMTGAWVEKAGPSPFPFVAWGDYDGNGLTDVVLILLGQHDWKVVAFHQLPTERYAAYELMSGPIGSVNPDNQLEYPKDRLISTVKKAIPTSVAHEPTEQTNDPIFFDHDSIRMKMSESGEAFYHWNGKQYDVQEESSE